MVHSFDFYRLHLQSLLLAAAEESERDCYYSKCADMLGCLSTASKQLPALVGWKIFRPEIASLYITNRRISSFESQEDRGSFKNV